MLQYQTKHIQYLREYSGIYYRLKIKHNNNNNQQFDKTLLLTSSQHVSAVKQPSSGQSRT
jgi:hypothetical protein